MASAVVTKSPCGLLPVTKRLEQGLAPRGPRAQLGERRVLSHHRPLQPPESVLQLPLPQRQLGLIGGELGARGREHLADAEARLQLEAGEGEDSLARGSGRACGEGFDRREDARDCEEAFAATQEGAKTWTRARAVLRTAKTATRPH